jgi:hypothetical protein
LKISSKQIKNFFKTKPKLKGPSVNKLKNRIIMKSAKRKRCSTNENREEVDSLHQILPKQHHEVNTKSDAKASQYYFDQPQSTMAYYGDSVANKTTTTSRLSSLAMPPPPAPPAPTTPFDYLNYNAYYQNMYASNAAVAVAAAAAAAASTHQTYLNYNQYLAANSSKNIVNSSLVHHSTQQKLTASSYHKYNNNNDEDNCKTGDDMPGEIDTENSNKVS